MCSTTFHSITKIKSIPAWIGGRRMKQIFGRPAGAGDVDWITRQHPIQSVENGLLLLVVGKWVYRGPVQSKRYWNFLSASSLKDSSCRDKTIAPYGLSLFSTLLWQWSLKGTDLLKKGFLAMVFYRFFDLAEERTAFLRDNSAINIFFFLPRFVYFILSEAFFNPYLRKLYPPPLYFPRDT